MTPPASTVAARFFSFGVLVLATAACGAETVPPEQSALEGGTSADTARVETVVRTSGAGGDNEFRTSSVIDFARGRSIFVDSASGCATIVIGHVSYTELPAELGLPEGKRWVRYSGAEDARDLEAQFEKSQEPQGHGDAVATLMFVVTPDPPPGEYLAHLRRHGDLDRIGEEEVRGVPTTGYRSTVDRKESEREQLAEMGWKAANIEAYLEQMSETEEEVDVWVDAEDRPRRVVTTSTTDAGLLGLHRSVTTTEYFDFGVDVEIVAPPAAEVLGEGEWERLNEKRMTEGQDSGEGAFEALPNAFAPSVQPTCRR